MSNFMRAMRVWHLGAIGIVLLTVWPCAWALWPDYKIADTEWISQIDRAGWCIIAISFGIVGICLPRGLALEERAHQLFRTHLANSTTLGQWPPRHRINYMIEDRFATACALIAMGALFLAAGLFVVVAVTQSSLWDRDDPGWRVAAPVLCLLCSQLVYLSWASSCVAEFGVEKASVSENEAKAVPPPESDMVRPP